MIRFRRPVLLFAILFALPTACASGSKKEPPADWATAFSTFRSQVREAAAPWANGVGKAFVEKLAQAQSAGEVLTQNVSGDSAGLVQSACSSLKTLSKQAGSGEDRTAHLDEADNALDRLLRDSAAAALL